MKRTILLVFVVLMSYTPTFSSGGDKLLKNFQNLPEDQRMAVYWYWMSDNISVDLSWPWPRHGDGSCLRERPVCWWCMDESLSRPVTRFLKQGKNHIRIEVVNNWRNRLIGDARLPQSERKTYATVNPYHANSSLQESGLLGPVWASLPITMIMKK